MELRFAYRADPLLIGTSFVLGVPFFLIGTVWAATGKIVTQGSLSLSPFASTIANMVFAFIGLAITAWGVRMVRHRDREILVSPERVLAPRGTAAQHSENIPVGIISTVTTGHSSSWGIHLELGLEGRPPLRLHRRFFADDAAFHACTQAMADARAGRLG